MPLDGSSFAEQALTFAIEIAQAAQASVRLALVHQAPPHHGRDPEEHATQTLLALRKGERSYLKAVAARVQELTGTRVTAVTLKGTVASALRDHIDRTSVDLVVMTTHGRGGLERAWVGSVADALVRTVSVPMFLVRPAEGTPAAAGFKVFRILIPLDGSTLSEQIIPPAVALARLLGAELSLVRLVEPIDFPPEVGENDSRVTALMQDQATDYLDSLAGTLRSEGLRVTTTIPVAPSVASGLLDLARDPGVGMIALATHGRGGLRRALLGSVADKIIRGAQVPVLVYRPKSAPKRSPDTDT